LGLGKCVGEEHAENVLGLRNLAQGTAPVTRNPIRRRVAPSDYKKEPDVLSFTEKRAVEQKKRK